MRLCVHLNYPTCCPLVRFSHIAPKGASKMLRATGHARMVSIQRARALCYAKAYLPCRINQTANWLSFAGLRGSSLLSVLRFPPSSQIMIIRIRFMVVGWLGTAKQSRAQLI